ncbi:GNAT family N-acetyltransferase [Teichococcus vastitatis]|uniref:GNAT family N-acetyltransferase n=1 Tax=Teichococcus vastitatis TaxID=2307076 RepID=A0ABS9W1V3_9PROT|nr:GNAT family N-acetyltransferase [Pseudoroseomonas vastitatis]MCI0753274.1 GNAT family N-acetyltransferase [Pseudoroseomonas vastitatis]
MSSSPGFTLREARPRDAETVSRLVVALAEYEKLGHEAKAGAADFYAALATKRVHGLIAEVEGEAIGFCLWYETFSTFTGKAGFWIEDVFVEPEHRRLGVGSAMFRKVAQIAVEGGYARVEWAVLDWNEPAIAFYRRIGAVAQDGWTDQRLSGEALTAFAGVA